MGEGSIILIRGYFLKTLLNMEYYIRNIYVNQIVITTRAYDEPLINEQTNERTHIANY